MRTSGCSFWRHVRLGSQAAWPRPHYALIVVAGLSENTGVRETDPTLARPATSVWWTCHPAKEYVPQTGKLVASLLTRTTSDIIQQHDHAPLQTSEGAQGSNRQTHRQGDEGRCFGIWLLLGLLTLTLDRECKFALYRKKTGLILKNHQQHTKASKQAHLQAE